jgi:hypothetical protein
MGLKLGRLDAGAVVARFYLASRGMYISFLKHSSGSQTQGSRTASEEINGAAEIGALLRKLRKNYASALTLKRDSSHRP